MFAARQSDGFSVGWVGPWETICIVIRFSDMDFRRRGPISFNWSRSPGIAFNCSAYAVDEGPVREAVEKKCSSRVMRGGKVRGVGMEVVVGDMVGVVRLRKFESMVIRQLMRRL